MKWEYCVATGVKEGNVIRVTWTTLKTWSYLNFTEFLNDHGSFGWELADVEHISNKAGFICTFKRPIEG